MTKDTIQLETLLRDKISHWSTPDSNFVWLGQSCQRATLYNLVDLFGYSDPAVNCPHLCNLVDPIDIFFKSAVCKYLPAITKDV